MMPLPINYTVKKRQIRTFADSCAPCQLRPVFTACVCLCPMLVATGKNTTCILMGCWILLLKPGTLLKHDLNITYLACVS